MWQTCSSCRGYWYSLRQQQLQMAQSVQSKVGISEREVRNHDHDVTNASTKYACNECYDIPLKTYIFFSSEMTLINSTRDFCQHVKNHFLSLFPKAHLHNSHKQFHQSMKTKPNLMFWHTKQQTNESGNAQKGNTNEYITPLFHFISRSLCLLHMGTFFKGYEIFQLIQRKPGGGGRQGRGGGGEAGEGGRQGRGGWGGECLTQRF